MPHDKNGKQRDYSKKLFKKSKLDKGEVDGLRKEFYARWGVVIDFDKQKPAQIFDTCLEIIPLALTEQRERLLDLLDRIIGAVIEDSCPPNKPPDDWDWDAIFDGFEQHFRCDLPDAIADYGDREALAREMFDIAEAQFLKKEESVGLDLTLRIFRHLYLEEIDKQWVEHLTDMEHLRDGIGLRGYGQKDPKQEYKKEGYNMFITLLARVSSSVVTKVMSAEARQEEEEEVEEADLARHMAELEQALASHADVSEVPVAPIIEEPAVLAEQECPCGSGEPFSECHGAPDEDADDDEDDEDDEDDD